MDAEVLKYTYQWDTAQCQSLVHISSCLWAAQTQQYWEFDTKPSSITPWFFHLPICSDVSPGVGLA